MTKQEHEFSRSWTKGCVKEAMLSLSMVCQFLSTHRGLEMTRLEQRSMRCAKRGIQAGELANYPGGFIPAECWTYDDKYYIRVCKPECECPICRQQVTTRAEQRNVNFLYSGQISKKRATSFAIEYSTIIETEQQYLHRVLPSCGRQLLAK